MLKISGILVVYEMTKKFTSNQILVKLRGWLPGEKATDNPAKKKN